MHARTEQQTQFYTQRNKQHTITTKTVLVTKKPRKRWKEEVERDLQVLGVRRWRELVADRKKWKDIFRQTKAHSGL